MVYYHIFLMRCVAANEAFVIDLPSHPMTVPHHIRGGDDRRHTGAQLRWLLGWCGRQPGEFRIVLSLTRPGGGWMGAGDEFWRVVKAVRKLAPANVTVV